ncbi:restriction endonuclease subunit S [Acinetobacter variabilis]|uniref:restriction endonuclease subunit S n=1 Tax=Acinetobacter TaxID=469 RepID=UPI0004498B71|nr:restriction endonuclease subunit S [Acinetobacter sp. 230853]EXB73469.1 type I restriction modification DNA specificity domain protein [Acinetobacter sp. 230853]
MAKYQSYAEYKDSGVEWLGNVPQHWALVPCRAVVDHIVEKNSNNALDNYLSLMANIGVIKYEDKGDVGNKKPDDLSKCKIVRKGQLVINSMNYAIGSYGMSPYDGICSPVYIVLQAKKDVFLERFALRIFENTPFQKYLATFGNGILEHRAAINWEDIKNKYVPLPTLDEQKNILDFLDHETTKIDHLIEKQQQLIELLKEKRQAVISHAVTKGLDPNVPMKDSGVEWLGEVPEHWKVAPIKRIINLMEQGKSPECENIPATSDQWGVLKTSCVNNGVFHANQNKALPENIKPHTQYQVKAGDVLMSRASGSINLIGSVALVPENVQENLLLSDKIFRIHLSKDCDSRFFTLLLATPYMRTLIERAISGAEGMANNITKTAILEFISAIPPLDEQLQLVVYLNQKIETFNSLIEKSSRAIEVMQERRTALISSAVTGKIDVRHWQAPTVAETHTELSA